jgi:hypothetical protein
VPVPGAAESTTHGLIPLSRDTAPAVVDFTLRENSNMFKPLIIAACLALPFAVRAADAAKEVTPQQQKMKSCNADAGKQKLEGDARKKFMSECLSADAPAAASGKELTPQQKKMKACNADAGKKKLEGDARKTFMSDCLKG